jgi:protease I
MLLYTARPVRDMTLTAYAGIAKDIQLLGGRYVDKPVVVDGPVVTSRGWPDLPAFMPAFIDVMREKV